MGIIPLQGTIGNIIFYKVGDKYFARTKGGPSSERVATDPKFQRTRENASEFGRAVTAAKLLRTAFQALVYANGDKLLARRLTSKMMSVLQADARNVRGMRKVVEGNASLLEGFEFNDHGQFSTAFSAPYTCSINRGTGELTITIPAFNPHEGIVAPESATHFKLMSAGAAVDFENNSYTTALHSSSELPKNTVATDHIILNNMLPANSTHSLFLVLGIAFFQEVNKSMYPLKDGSFNALAIVKVSG
jgi:hypothetical protein